MADALPLFTTSPVPACSIFTNMVFKREGRCYQTVKFKTNDLLCQQVFSVDQLLEKEFFGKLLSTIKQFVVTMPNMLALEMHKLFICRLISQLSDSQIRQLASEMPLHSGCSYGEWLCLLGESEVL